MDTTHAIIGGLIRKIGWVTGCRGRNICSHSIARDELWGALTGLEMAWNIGVYQVLLKMDSQMAMHAILEIEVIPSEDSLIIH